MRGGIAAFRNQFTVRAGETVLVKLCHRVGSVGRQGRKAIDQRSLAMPGHPSRNEERVEIESLRQQPRGTHAPPKREILQPRGFMLLLATHCLAEVEGHGRDMGARQVRGK